MNSSSNQPSSKVGGRLIVVCWDGYKQIYPVSAITVYVQIIIFIFTFYFFCYIFYIMYGGR